MGRRADYEGRVLKGVYYYPDRMLLPVLTGLEPDDFTDPVYRKFYYLLMDYSKNQLKPSQVTLADFIDGTDFDPAVITNVTSLYNNPEQLIEPIKQIKNRTALAQLGKYFKDWLTDTEKSTTDSGTLITQMYEEVAKVQKIDIDYYNAQAIAKRTLTHLNQLRERGKGWTTDIPSLDFITYGMQPQRMWLVGGYTSVGKSWVGIHFAKKLLEQGVKTLIITMEMSAEDVFTRLTAAYVNRQDIAINKIMDKANKPQIEEYDAAALIVGELPLYIVDNLNNWEQVSGIIRYYAHTFGVQAVLLDYVQNVATSKGSEYEGLNVIVWDLQRMSVDLNLFVVAFSQINRESARSQDNEVFGFKGSGNLENAADVAMTLRKQDNPKERLLVVGKNRHGDIGEIHLWVNFDYGWITENTGFREVKDDKPARKNY
jgi:replicative DNA helicase